MRLVTWNCQAGLDKKIEVIRRLNPDILVLQECNESNALSIQPGVSNIWRTPGRPGQKGFGIYGFNGFTVTPIDPAIDYPWVIPCEVVTPTGDTWARLLGIWTNVQKNIDRPTYAGQFASTLHAWSQEISTFPTIIAGDLNASMQGPSKLPHAQNIESAKALGLQSAYHLFNNVEHGEEPDMTLKWIGPGKIPYFYHCDFVFVSPQFQANGSCHIDQLFSSSETHISDHQAVVVDFPMTH
jgi:endonuclease/exonuclease/phosphatase family metal-dependent hydrolase